MPSALLVIDVQNEYVDGAMPISYPALESSLPKIGTAMDYAAQAAIPVVIIQHTAAEPESPVFVRDSHGWQLHPVVTERRYDEVIEKHLPGSFTGTSLGKWIEQNSIDHLVICGYMTHMCVDTTTRQAVHRGMKVSVLSDATGTLDLGPEAPAEMVHKSELAVLGSVFATVQSVDDWIKQTS